MAWEQTNSCMMPDDLKSFYMTANGFHMQWSSQINDQRIVVGKMKVNPIEKLLRLGGASSAERGFPSVSDIDLDSSDEEDEGLSKPKFDHRSRVFELDPCDGYGKVCYVYRNTKPGVPAQKAEVWFLDRALRWHFLANNFLNYFRLMIIHMGLPQWQYVFTDIGVSAQAKQWFHLYCPLRLNVDEDNLDTDTLLGELSQVDVARVFKGKDKKKAVSAGTQPVKKKPPLPSARSLPGTKAAGGSTAPGNRPART